MVVPVSVCRQIIYIWLEYQISYNRTQKKTSEITRKNAI